MDSQQVQDHDAIPQTHFAPAARAGDAEVRAAIGELAENPIIDAAMLSFSGLLAVLNEERQILATNTALVKTIGIDRAADALGLRPGEVLQCVHAGDHPAGCGTGEFCSSCGAAIAIVTSQQTGHPVERDCVMTVSGDEHSHEIYLSVRCSPILIAGHRHLLLFLQDQTAEHHRAELERTFFHDISNLIVALQGASELLDPPGRADRELVDILRTQSARLVKEVEIQRTLAYDGGTTYRLKIQTVELDGFIEELRGIFDHHPAAQGRTLHLIRPAPGLSVQTDASLLMRVVTNMLVNAVEATDEGLEVRLRIEVDRTDATFSVWNHQSIPEHLHPRVFQRHFSTKSGGGRGLGCYAMKLFGERYLGGRVLLASSRAAGTEFRFTLPRTPAKTD